MRTASPFWLSIVLAVGLLFVFIGERLSTIPEMRVVISGIGIAAILLVTAARAWAWSSSKAGARKRIDGTLLLCHLGTVLALFLYAMTTSWGPTSLEGPQARGALTVLYAILIVVSMTPVLLIEISLGAALRTGFDPTGEEKAESQVDLMRVRESGWSGLSLAFAMALLMVTCQVAKERNATRDVSYFKTSAAGESTQNIVKAGTEPLRVYLFFQETQDAKRLVENYFDSLASDTGKVEVSTHDRLIDADLAAKYKVTKDGVIVLARGKDAKEKSGNIEIPEKELKDAEVLRKSATLRTLDAKVNKELLKIAREKRKAYVMTGHGEMNDPDSVPADLKGKVPERRTTKFKAQLLDSNYEVKDLGLIDLAKDVPDDATIVVLLAPTLPLLDAEWAALERYLDRGGRILIALDPKADGSLGPLETKLGLKFNPGDLTDDAAFLPQRGTPADRRYAITTQFSAHASTTALSRSVDKGLVLIDAGALEDVPFRDGPNPPKKTVTLRSMESAFLDFNNNFTFDKDSEKKQRWNIGVALEGPKMPDGKDGFRALVFSDSDLFADALIQNQLRQTSVILVSGPLLRDSIGWLGGEEVFGGEIVSEEDKPVEHTKNEEAAWFLLTVVGVPLLVLGLGLGFTSMSKRRRGSKKVQVTP
ncbi:MAG: Gldg family protein [Kofleriaceae bacterium]